MNSLVEKYIYEGKIGRSILAGDIAKGRISKDELQELLHSDVIRESYFVNVSLKKVSQTEWNESYLKLLSCASISECFNEEYLLYLFDVACYVNQKKDVRKKYKKIISSFIVFILIITAVACLFKTCKKSNAKNVEQTKSEVVYAGK